MRHELEQAKDYIDKTYGTLEKRKVGFPEVSLILTRYNIATWMFHNVWVYL